MEKKSILVVIGVILNPQNQILIARRNFGVHLGGKWEFPGGKVEENESLTDALIREMREELDIEVLASQPLCTLEHDYGDRHVKLECFTVTRFSGEAHGKEGQPIRWVPLAELDHYEFPEANLPLIDALKRAQKPKIN